MHSLYNTHLFPHKGRISIKNYFQSCIFLTIRCCTTETDEVDTRNDSKENQGGVMDAIRLILVFCVPYSECSDTISVHLCLSTTTKYFIVGFTGFRAQCFFLFISQHHIGFHFLFDPRSFLTHSHFVSKSKDFCMLTPLCRFIASASHCSCSHSKLILLPHRCISCADISPTDFPLPNLGSWAQSLLKAWIDLFLAGSIF